MDQNLHTVLHHMAIETIVAADLNLLTIQKRKGTPGMTELKETEIILVQGSILNHIYTHIYDILYFL